MNGKIETSYKSLGFRRVLLIWNYELTLFPLSHHPSLQFTSRMAMDTTREIFYIYVLFLLDLKAEDFALLFKFYSYVQLNLSIP